MDQPGGRARGKARGRARGQPQAQGQPSGMPQPQGHPSGISQQQHPQPHGGRAGARPKQEPQRRDEGAGPSGHAAHRPGAAPTSGDLSHQMRQMSVSGGAVPPRGNEDNGNGNGNGVPAAGRGSIRGGRRIDMHPSMEIVTRPKSITSKRGTEGVAIKLQANYFKLIKKPDWSLYHHRVEYAPEEDSLFVQRGLLAAHKEKLGGFLFDGFSMWTTNRLCRNKDEKLELYSKKRSNDQNVRITIRMVAQVDSGDHHYLQVFNIIMRNCLRHMNLKLVGRNYFDCHAEIDIPEHCLKLWPGYVTSIKQHEDEILLCCEVTHKVMRQDTALACYDDLRQSRNQRNDFRDLIVGVTVLTRYTNRTYRVDDVDYSLTPSSTFLKKDGTSISYKDYYQQRYDLKITRADQPLLLSRSKEKNLRAGEPQLVYLIPEFCNMTGLTDSMRANFNLMKALAVHTRVEPTGRIKKLGDFNRRLTSNEGALGELTRWNMSLDKNLVTINARQLPPELIVFKDREVDAGKETDWTRCLRNTAMLYSARLTCWVAIAPGRNIRDMESFAMHLQTAGKGLSFPIPPPVIIDIPNDRIDSYIYAIDKAIHTHNPQLVMILASNNKADRYGAVKKKCVLDHGVPSQVILVKTATNRNALSIATKVAIQMNAKLGGAPWTVRLPTKAAMVIGFDVCHDSQDKRRSFSAMVASLDGNLTRYYSTVTPRQAGEEISDDFSQNILKALMKYREVNNGTLPQFIIIYRDGVGEGQINYVYEHEVASIKKLIGDLYDQNQKTLKLAFIIVTKKINSRFFLNGQNPLAGTVVDDVVTLPTRYDFYLISQSVRQGTVSPTHYNVIEDTLGLKPNDLQKFTYKMTHMYYNWSGTVCVPAPCQYAHKLAFLTGQSLRSHHDNMSDLLYFL